MSWKSVSLRMWQCQWESSNSHFERLWCLHLQGWAVQEEPWKLRHHDPSLYLEMLTQGHSFHPRRLRFVTVLLWVPQILQHVNCLCDTLLTGSEDWHYHIWLDLTVMQWYCRNKCAVLWDLFPSSVWSVVCVCVYVF